MRARISRPVLECKLKNGLERAGNKPAVSRFRLEQHSDYKEYAQSHPVLSMRFCIVEWQFVAERGISRKLKVSKWSVQKVARQTGVSDETLRRWMELAEFADVVDEALEQSLRDSLQKAAGADLAAVLPGAIATIRGTLNDPKAKPRTKLLAARTAWDIALKIRALKDRLKRPHEC